MGTITFLVHTLPNYLFYYLHTNYPIIMSKDNFLLWTIYILILGRYNAWSTKLGEIIKLIMEQIAAEKLLVSLRWSMVRITPKK